MLIRMLAQLPMPLSVQKSAPIDKDTRLELSPIAPHTPNIARLVPPPTLIVQQSARRRK